MSIQNHFTILSLLASPRQSYLYLVSDGSSRYVLKTSRTNTEADREAFEDEYETLKNISHPILPRYYAYFPAVSIPDSKEPVPALLLEYVEGTPLSSLEHLTTKQLKKYILHLGDGLLALLSAGVLYTDLHPGNLIITKDRIKLIDFTRAYYFLRNPYPSYTPKISYHLDQNLKGQQLLVQSLTFLLKNLPEHLPTKGIPDSLLELGMHPHNSLIFSDFLNLLQDQWNE